MSSKISSRMLPTLAGAALVAALASFHALAQSPGGPAGHTGHTSAAPAGAAASTKAFEAANAKMHQGMDIKFTGNADVDFVRGMLPHHEGAVDMARIVLEHGKDRQVRKLARDIIKAQEKEIAWMKRWLAKHEK